MWNEKVFLILIFGSFSPMLFAIAQLRSENTCANCQLAHKHTHTHSLKKNIQTQLPNPQFVLWYCVKSFDFVI